MRLAIALVVSLLSANAWAIDLSPEQARGQRVYREGVGAGGEPITARVGREGAVVPASAVPCAGCHGRDGKGRPEGGVEPPPVTWSYLTKSYGHEHAFGRRHPAFTEETLARSIAEGADPAGNVLNVAMPRYTMAASDMADLISYLKRIEQDLDPGLSDSVLRLGTLLPMDGPLGELGQSMRGVMEAYCAEVNASGGVHGRRLELAVASLPEAGPGRAGSIGRLMGEDVLALVSPFTTGVEAEATRLAEAGHVPVVGPFTLFPEAAAETGRYSFYLFPGLAGEARALVEYAARQLGLQNPTVAVLHPEGEEYAPVVAAVVSQAARHGWERVQSVTFAPGAFDLGGSAAAQAEAGADVVLLLGGREGLSSFLQGLRSTGSRPYLMLPGSLASEAVLRAAEDLGDRVYLAFPTLPSDQGGSGLQSFRELQEKHGLQRRHLAAQTSAYVAAEVLVEALKRAGRDVSRESLLQTLERLVDFQTGMTRPVTYGPLRRVGLYGAHIVGVDPATRSFKPTGVWVTLD